MPTTPPLRAVASAFGTVVRPIQEFFRLEAASGILLFAAAVAAMVWANSPSAESYRTLFATPVIVGLGGATARVTFHQVINEGLMSVFFFVVGMEIKRELVAGELRTLRRAMLPAIAAVGGMLVPSAIYLAFNWTGPGRPGWAIPMATDIAFCIGALTLLGKRVPHALIVFLTALAIFDDIGGILVIAFFYGHGISGAWLLGAAVIAAIAFVMGRAYVRSGAAYALCGVALWYALHHGGIHATISGVVLGLAIPSRPRRRAREVLDDLTAYTATLTDRTEDDELDEASILHIEEKLEDLEAPLARFIHALHPWVAFLVMPLFALANSGVGVREMGFADLIGPVALGATLGLAVKAGFADRPGGVGWTRVLGVSIVGGIGFTVALFIGALAFPGSAALLDQAKVGILLGSLISGGAGMLLLRLLPRAPE
jgi:NhaA family Na+:H+ antiporter